MQKFKWTLNDSQFTWKDRFTLAKFFLNPKNRWTQDKLVKQYEKEMANFIGAKYAVFVSSGSTANTALAYRVRDVCRTRRNVVLPAVTWQTSCSPWIREGFNPVFIDVNLQDLSMDLAQLETYLAENHQKVACVFITSLLGFVPNIDKILKLKNKYKVEVMFDNCENTLGLYSTGIYKYANISTFLTSTTSTYFGHQLQSIEGGFIFTEDEEEYEYFTMIRNHGMVRSLQNTTFGTDKNAVEEYSNDFVDSRFDFAYLGNNFRNTELNALVGLLDLKRANTYLSHRNSIYEYFRLKVREKNILTIDHRPGCYDAPFAIPIIYVGKNAERLRKGAQEICEAEGIETRPIISGNLLRQSPYQRYGDFKSFPIAEMIHQCGFYVGLHSGVSIKNIDQLITILDRV